MKVAILCGGQGTRIRDVADNIPKPMITVGNFPIIWHIMKYYSTWGHKDFVLCLGYKGTVIKDFFLNYEAYTNDVTIELGKHNALEYHHEHDESGWKVTLANTGLNAMTGARVKRIKRFMEGEEHFMLTYGDGLSDVDIDRLFRFHVEQGKIMTITGVRPPGRFGEVGFEDQGLVRSFNEKPQASGGWISGGYFVCRKEIFNYLNDDESLVLEKGPMNQLVEDGQMVLYQHEGFWQCMDTFRDFQLLNGMWEDANCPWKRW